jgi:hypothetical protein
MYPFYWLLQQTVLSVHCSPPSDYPPKGRHHYKWSPKINLSISTLFNNGVSIAYDRLCGLVGRVPDYRVRGPGFYSRRYQVFWEVLGLERGPLSLVSTTEELLGRKSSGSGLEIREYGLGIRHADYATMLTPTSPTSGGSSVGIVR